MNILLVCGAGASTSLLVTKMLKVAKELGEEHNIRAIAQTAIKSELPKADVVLLGPQITFMLDSIKELADGKGIPVAVIRMQDYGMCDGAKVLEYAKKLKTSAVV